MVISDHSMMPHGPLKKARERNTLFNYFLRLKTLPLSGHGLCITRVQSDMTMAVWSYRLSRSLYFTA